MERLRTRRRGALLLIGGVAVLVLALFSQRALAEQVGGFIAGLWISTMDVVLRLVGAVFGLG